MGFATIIGAVAAIAVTIFLYVKVIPAKFDGSFKKKTLQFIHDYFNFKNLYLEAVLKVIFTILSVACITVGLLGATLGNIIQFFSNIVDSVNYGYFGSWVWEQLFEFFFGGIALALLGPLVLRLAYEVILMFILLVKNVIEINKKLKAPEAPIEDESLVIEVEETIPVEEEVVIAEEVAPEVEEVPEVEEAPAEEAVEVETSFEIGEPEEEETTEE